MSEHYPKPLPGLIGRTDMEQREAAMLAGYAMRSADSRGRQHDEGPLSDRGIYRSVYQRDRDRIVHCTAFRRLEYKTQVFITHVGDYYRTRLTHTIEVAQISRQIARSLRLNEDLCETIALAHDLGHTPFGHAGEDALHNLMVNSGGFEHNSQGLRVVDLLEHRYPDFPGLNLTYELRESLAKHRTRYDHSPGDDFSPDEMPLLEAQVIDAADEIAYNNHDIDDGLAAGILDEAELKQNCSLWADTYRRVEGKFPNVSARAKRQQTVAALINLEMVDLMEHSYGLIGDHGIRTVADVRSADRRLICSSPDLTGRRKELQGFLEERLYNHYAVLRMTNKAKRFIEGLFHEYTRNPNELSYEYQRWADEVGCERAVCDYIAGMTDRFAQNEYRMLFQPFERT